MRTTINSTAATIKRRCVQDFWDMKSFPDVGRKVRRGCYQATSQPRNCMGSRPGIHARKPCYAKDLRSAFAWVSTRKNVMMGRLLVAVMIKLVRFYQIGISPLLGPSCRFTPTCSQYAIEVIRRDGPVRGDQLVFTARTMQNFLFFVVGSQIGIYETPTNFVHRFFSTLPIGTV